ncbi:hypothetical protein Tco_0054085 [Tanacetum coccineum]
MTISPLHLVRGTDPSYETAPFNQSLPVSSTKLPSPHGKRYRAAGGRRLRDTAEATNRDEPLGLGYEAARRRALELAEGTMPSTYEVGQSSRSTLDEQIAYDTPTPRLHVRTTWEDPKDGTIYMDIECDMPLVRPPIQTLPSPV